MTAVCQAEEGLGLAHVVRSEGKPRLSFCVWLAAGPENREALLQEEVKRRRVSRVPAVGVMEFGSYGLYQVAPPSVPDEELREAVRWQVKDLIDFPLEEAVVDVFRVTTDNRRDGAKTAYVVAARQALVGACARLMRQARLRIQVIDIPELALRNLACLLPEEPRGVALLYLAPHRGVIVVSRGGRLQLARDIPFGTELLSGVGNMPDDPWELLALDIQRSLDFYESTFRQTPVAALALVPPARPLPDLAEALQSRLSTVVKRYDLAEALHCEGPLPEHAERCVLAIGAALRDARGGE
jgi:MSHA biogenesis protein MshI